MRQFLNVLLIGAALMMVACGAGEADTKATASSSENAASETVVAEESAPAVEDLTANAAIMATLNAADAFDGNADKVVSKCASCALMMDGKPENKVDVAGFEMHFCSTACQDSYKTNAKDRLETLNVPSE